MGEMAIIRGLRWRWVVPLVEGRYAVGSNVPLGLPGQLMPTLGATGEAQMVGKVRAPVPSNVQLQDSSQRDSPPTPLVHSQLVSIRKMLPQTVVIVSMLTPQCFSVWRVIVIDINKIF